MKTGEMKLTQEEAEELIGKFTQGSKGIRQCPIHKIILL